MQLILLALMLLWGTIAQAATYYIAPSGNNSNSCAAAQNQSTPRQTLLSGAGCLSPGDTLVALPGTYVHLDQVQTTIAGTAGARILYSGYGAILDGQRPFDGDPNCVWWNTGNYTDIEGFEITSTAGNPSIGLCLGASHVSATHNHIHHIPAAGYGENGGACLLTNGLDYTGVDATLTHNLVHDCGYNVTGADFRVQGIYTAHPQVVVQNNIVYRVEGTGISAWHGANDHTISNNLVFVCDDDGIQVGAGDAGAISFTNSIIANNIIRNVTDRGIYETGTTGTDNQYLNNLIYNATGGISLMNGSNPGTLVNTFTSDPLQVNYQADGSGDYRLTASSPAVNSGTTTGAPAADYVGILRPRLFKVDRGPYEYVPACF